MEIDEDASRAQASRAGAYQWADLTQRTFPPNGPHLADARAVSTPRASMPGAPMPVLHGQPAIDYLTQQGSYASLQEAIAAVPYRVEPTPRATAATDPSALDAYPDAYQAANPEQGYRTHFTPERIVITAAAEAATTSASPAWEVGLTLAAYGRGQDLRPVKRSENQ